MCATPMNLEFSGWFLFVNPRINRNFEGCY